MADGVNITPGTGVKVIADEVTDATLGTGQVQYVKLMDGTLDGTTKAAVGANGLATDVKAVVPGTGATNLGKAEDAAHTSADVGVMALAVRKDAASALAGTDGDYIPLIVDSLGRLWVASIYAEDAAHTSGDTGNLILAVRKDTAAALAGTDGDYAPLEVDANGRLHVMALTGSGASDLGKAEDAAHNSADVGVMALAVRKDTAAALAGSDGDYAPLEVDSTGRLHTVANPVSRTLTIVTGTAASSGDNSIVAAPGVGVRIVVKYLIVQNETAVATTSNWRDGTTSKWRSYNAAAGNGMVLMFDDGAEWRLATNAALQLNLSGANSHGYSVGYWTE